MKNYLREGNLFQEQIEKNRQLEKSYLHIIDTVKKISASLDDPGLKDVIEVDHREYPHTLATMFECITPYCCISLGADETGYFSITYSIDYRAPEFIGTYALAGLLRNIHRYTMVDFTDTMIEHRVLAYSLSREIDFQALKDHWSQDTNKRYVILPEQK